GPLRAVHGAVRRPEPLLRGATQRRGTADGASSRPGVPGGGAGSVGARFGEAPPGCEASATIPLAGRRGLGRLGGRSATHPRPLAATACVRAAGGPGGRTE